MHPDIENTLALARAFEWERDELLIQTDIGNALRCSFESMASDPLPSQMALLLLQIATAEITCDMAAQERIAG